MEPSERLEQFLVLKNLSYDSFAEKVGAAKGQRDKYVGKSTETKRKSTFSYKFYRNFSVVGLNSTWYLTGDGDMLLDENSNSNVRDVSTSKTIPVLNISSMSIDQLREYRKVINEQSIKIDKILKAVDEE